MENNQQEWSFPGQTPEESKKPFFPAGSRELIFALVLTVIGSLLCNSMLYSGFHLGFALFSGCAVICSTVYLLCSGRKMDGYTGALLGLSLVICGSFSRSDDGFVKFIMLCFLLLSSNLGLCLLSGQNRRSANGLTSLLDAPRTVFTLGLGKLPESIRGLRLGVKSSGSAGRKSGAVLLGLLIAIPLLAIVIPLLISADAAFDALLQQLPDWDFGELLGSLIGGVMLSAFLYTRGTALRHGQKASAAVVNRKGIHPLTVNTVLITVSVVYGVYLFSQLAYFAGGFSGILPEGYTAAEYARRGFFEMAWLCAINLGIIALAVGLVVKNPTSPLLTRLICLFIGIVTLFLAVSASAKMFLYIDGFGLTRLRVLTQVIIFFIGLSTVLVCVWLFVPKLAYMKVILLIGFVFGAAVAWADVDTVVAAYNVNAYQTGKLETVDVSYLDSLGKGAIPYIARLTDDPDPSVADAANNALEYGHYSKIEDFREWNFAAFAAEDYIRLPDDKK